MGAIYEIYGTYIGPGDVVSGAAGWWGLRAYTGASIGNNAVDLRRDSDNSVHTFTTVTGGGLNLSAISSFKGAANLFVSKLYDQSGHGLDMVQATTAQQPGFALSGLGSLPIMTFIQSQSGISTSATFTAAQPFTQSVVCAETGNIGGFAFVFVGTTTSDGPAFNSAGAVRLYGLNNSSPVAGPNAADGTVYAVQMVSNGSTLSVMYVNGSSTTLTGLGTTGLANENLVFGNTTFTGNITEGGVWYSALSAGQQSNMNNNQRAYWGF